MSLNLTILIKNGMTVTMDRVITTCSIEPTYADQSGDLGRNSKPSNQKESMEDRSDAIEELSEENIFSDGEDRGTASIGRTCVVEPSPPKAQKMSAWVCTEEGNHSKEKEEDLEE